LRNALLSVYHKEGIVEFAQALVKFGFKLYASGGTAKALSESGIPVTDVAELTGRGAILRHRVVTLSGEIHAGLLAGEEDMEELHQLGLPRIDLVCVDLYPLQAEIERPGSTRESVIELTDVGGPTMLHSAAKGSRIVICDPADRQQVIKWLEDGRPNEEEFLTYLAAKAEFVVANYCGLSANYHSDGGYHFISGRRVAQLRYGENPQQEQAFLYTTDSGDPLAVDQFKIVAGNPGWMNTVDADRLLSSITTAAAYFDRNNDRGVSNLAIGVKHGNPCGAAYGQAIDAVIGRMLDGDPRAIFGGVVMTNFEIGEGEAEILLHHNSKERRLLDGIIAPAFSEGAIELLQRKGSKGFLYVNPALGTLSLESLSPTWQCRQVRGGFLLQQANPFVLDWKDERLQIFPGSVAWGQGDDIGFAWGIGSRSNSNTITLVKDGTLIGNGVGRQDRIGAAELALKIARDGGHDPRGAVAYSDSFFPYDDGPKVLIEAGIKVIFASSGSVRDKEVIKVCQEAGVTLCLIPDKVGRGFFGH
jgi:phosphoribosylaminoimidazolecarboxamide formyltransferase/IMP cyclohydrolase